MGLGKTNVVGWEMSHPLGATTCLLFLVVCYFISVIDHIHPGVTTEEVEILRPLIGAQYDAQDPQADDVLVFGDATEIRKSMCYSTNSLLCISLYCFE